MPEPAHQTGPSHGLRRRIRIAFLIQAAAIALTTILGIYGARIVFEDVLLQRALGEEADYFADRQGMDAATPLPDTHNLRAYLSPPRVGDPPVPDDLRSLPPGYHRVVSSSRAHIAHVSDVPAGRLYVVFAQEPLSRLAVFFGLVPLSLVLIAVYLIVWLTYRSSKRAVSPVIWLANQVRAWDPKEPDFENLSAERMPAGAGGEVAVLAEALHRFAKRNRNFLQRERNFTRDASHELRSPLTVIKIACDMLLSEGTLDAYGEKNIRRIRRSATEMSTLVEAFLILARESDIGLAQAQENFLVNDVVLEEIDRAQALVAGRPLVLRAEQQAELRLHAPPRVLAVVVGNLIRNACQYTERGEVVVVIDRDRIRVRDTGAGMKASDVEQVFEPFYRAEGTLGKSGYGIGLTIVKRLSDRFGWQVAIASRYGAGTTVTIRFAPESPASP